MPGTVPAEVGRTLVSDFICSLFDACSPEDNKASTFEQSKMFLIAQGGSCSHGLKLSSERFGAHARALLQSFGGRLKMG